jgi:hypothetical protein
VYHFEKYDTKASPALHVWSWVQIGLTLLFISYLFGNITAINAMNASYIYIYGVFVFLSVYAYTDLMDRNRSALIWELIKNSFGIAILYQTGDWFGTSKLTPVLNYLVIAYFIFSSFITAYFVVKHEKEDAVPALTS